MRNNRQSVVQLFFGHNRRLPVSYGVNIGLGEISEPGNLVSSCGTASEIGKELLNFARVRRIAVCWKRHQLSSARFEVRSVFRKEWPLELNADLVEGLTARQDREFFFAWGSAP